MFVREAPLKPTPLDDLLGSEGLAALATLPHGGVRLTFFCDRLDH